jgi:carbonic anhydrase
MAKIKKINTINDIPKEYQKTPIAQLIEFQNFGRPHNEFDNAQMIIGSCMDNRTQLNVPNKFAFIIRNGGARLQFSEFHISYAISIAKLKYMAVIGHTDCGMVNLKSKKDLFIQGLAENAGWDEGNAERFFNHYSHQFEIGNEVDFTLNQVIHLRKRFPEIQVVPMIYKVEDDKIYLINE